MKKGHRQRPISSDPDGLPWRNAGEVLEDFFGFDVKKFKSVGFASHRRIWGREGNESAPLRPFSNSEIAALYCERKEIGYQWWKNAQANQTIACYDVRLYEPAAIPDLRAEITGLLMRDAFQSFAFKGLGVYGDSQTLNAFQHVEQLGKMEIKRSLPIALREAKESPLFLPCGIYLLDFPIWREQFGSFLQRVEARSGNPEKPTSFASLDAEQKTAVSRAAQSLVAEMINGRAAIINRLISEGLPIYGFSRQSGKYEEIDPRLFARRDVVLDAIHGDFRFSFEDHPRWQSLTIGSKQPRNGWFKAAQASEDDKGTWPIIEAACLAVWSDGIPKIRTKERDAAILKQLRNSGHNYQPNASTLRRHLKNHPEIFAANR